MLKIFRAGFLVTAAILLSSGMAHADAAGDTAACDAAASSPLDTTRPAGIAGVTPDKIDGAAAVAACEKGWPPPPMKAA
ncbi:MAG: hypothetical protein U1E15_10905 [Hyphomicrobiales bacterium]